mgnify:CR=1 FL=1
MNRVDRYGLAHEIELVQSSIYEQFDIIVERIRQDEEPITKLIVDELLDETVKYLTFMQARLNEIKSLVDEEGKQG